MPQPDPAVPPPVLHPPTLDPSIAARLKRDAAGLVPAIVQDADSRDVLMLGYMDDEALRRTLTTGRVTFWSRSRGEYWRKGDTSGHVQYVHGVAMDCDGDTVLVTVRQIGPACHTGTATCFTGRDLPAQRTDTDSRDIGNPGDTSSPHREPLPNLRTNGNPAP